MNDSQPLNPMALTVEQLAQILSATGKRLVSVEMIETDLETGAPKNPDGTINLVNYAAWLVKEAARGD